MTDLTDRIILQKIATRCFSFSNKISKSTISLNHLLQTEHFSQKQEYIIVLTHNSRVNKIKTDLDLEGDDNDDLAFPDLTSINDFLFDNNRILLHVNVRGLNANRKDLEKLLLKDRYKTGHNWVLSNLVFGKLWSITAYWDITYTTIIAK